MPIFFMPGSRFKYLTLKKIKVQLFYTFKPCCTLSGAAFLAER